MFSWEKYESILCLVILPPDLLFTVPKLLERTILIILKVRESSNLPFRLNYLYLQIDL